MASQPTQSPEPTNPVPAAPPPPQGFTLLAALGVFGLLLVFLALGYWIITQDFGTPARLLLGAAGICLAIFFWFNPGSLANVFSLKGVRYSSNTLVLVAAFIGIVIVLNLLASRYVLAQADLTANQQYTLSDQSKQVVQSLSQNVNAVAFFTNQDVNRQQAEDLLRQYKALSPHFSYEFVDYQKEPLRARDYQITTAGTTVFEISKDQRESVTNVSETDFTGALIKLLNPTTHSVYFLTGHGEPSTSPATSAGQPAFSSFVGSLTRERYEVKSLNLLQTKTVPISGTTTLVIANPQKPLSDPEIAAINTFLDNGGRLLLLGDSPFTNASQQDGQATLASLNKLLARYGASLGSGIILDPVNQQAGGDASILLVNQYQNAIITRNLNGLTSAFVLANAVITDQPAITDTTVTRTPLIYTSNTSALYTSLTTTNGQTKLDPTKTTPGPLTLAATIEYGSADNANTPRKHSRIVVFGDSDFASDSVLLSQGPPPANADLALNSVNWLNEADQLSGIRPKTADVRTLNLRPADANVIFYSSVVVLPLVVLVIGLVIWWRRR